MYSDHTFIPGRLAVIGRRVAAFILNLGAAILGVTGFLRPFYKFLRLCFPSMPLTQREISTHVILAALVALAVTQFWSTTTAKWIWLVPVPLLLVRMAFFFVGAPLEDGIMGQHPHGLWNHFFDPDISGGLPARMDLNLFTFPALQATVYSCIAWASDHWGWHVPAETALPSSEGSRPAAPVTWARLNDSWFTATNVLIGTNVGIFGAMVVAGVPLLFRDKAQLLRLGADLGTLSLHGQYWRLITAPFVHVGIFHLAANMICLWWLGRLAEKIFGGGLLTGIYLLTAVGGELLSAAWDPLKPSVGVSGGLMGIAGALFVVSAYGGIKFPRNELFRRRITIVICFFMFDGLSAFVSDMGHTGGLAVGLLIGFCIVWAVRRPSFPKELARIRLAQGLSALEAHDYQSAIGSLQSYVAVRPNDADGHALLGYALQALDRPDEAASEYQTAVTLGCTDAAVRDNLAGIHSEQGSPEGAVPVAQEERA